MDNYSKTKINKNKQLAADLLISATTCDHRPVLLTTVCRLSDVFKDRAQIQFLDLTAGQGGHARAICQLHRVDSPTLVDRDPVAIAKLRSDFPTADLICQDFVVASRQLVSSGRQFDLILLDLGLSLNQLRDSQRGFSFLVEGPLDMRFNQSTGKSLADLFAISSIDDLTRVLVDYGQERWARPIATAIKRHRPQTTLQLANLIGHLKPYSRHHPATKAFMAFRIWVNDELNQLQQLLPLAVELLKPQGRLIVISFHSLEDRQVKRFFKVACQPGYDSRYQLLTKRPLTQDDNNPQARSAKLRALQRK